MFITNINRTDSNKRVFLKDENGNTIECLYKCSFNTHNRKTKKDVNSLHIKEQHPLQSTSDESDNLYTCLGNVRNPQTKIIINNFLKDFLDTKSKNIMIF